jgi:hypothetical protein
MALNPISGERLGRSGVSAGWRVGLGHPEDLGRIVDGAVAGARTRAVSGRPVRPIHNPPRALQHDCLGYRRSLFLLEDFALSFGADVLTEGSLAKANIWAFTS